MGKGARRGFLVGFPGGGSPPRAGGGVTRLSFGFRGPVGGVARAADGGVGTPPDEEKRDTIVEDVRIGTP